MNNKVLHKFYLFVIIVDITMIIVVPIQLQYRKSIRENLRYLVERFFYELYNHVQIV